MARTITLNIDDQLDRWLSDSAAAKGTSIEALITAELQEAMDRTSELTWQEEDVLGIFRVQNARPDQDINPQALAMAWGTRGPIAELWAALDRLEEKRLVARNATNTAYHLTKAGYSRQ